MTTTIERPPAETTSRDEAPHRQNRTLRFLILLLGIVLLVLAGIFVLTSLIGFCPLYYPFGISTCKKSDQSG